MIKKQKINKSGKVARVDPRGIVRGGKTRVKTARYRKSSSTRWLQRQLNDPYVAASKRDGYRSRAAYKLLELDDRFSFLHGVHTVVDLGAAPGGWTQVARHQCAGDVSIIGIDLLEVRPILGATFLEMDFTTDEAEKVLLDLIDGPIDLVMSDMAVATTGHQNTDYIRTLGLVELAFDFAKKTLAKNGTFVAKVFSGGTETELLKDIRANFTKVRHFKPPASRSESKETYLVAQGFKKSS
jgi:23S rRNA (uridine2552-2'-O)-methyltransferase